jgi:hypothetical protein
MAVAAFIGHRPPPEADDERAAAAEGFELPYED